MYYAKSVWNVHHLTIHLLVKEWKMVNFNWARWIISISRAWDKEKIWALDRIRTYDLPNTGRVLYPLSYGCSILRATGALSTELRVLYPLSYGCSIHWVTGALSSEFSVAQWIERPPGVWEVIGSNPVRDSDFLFVPRSWNDDYFIFIYIYIYILQLRPLTKQHKNTIVNSTY